MTHTRILIPILKISLFAALFTVFVYTAFAYTTLQVFGQADFTGGQINAGGETSAESLNTPLGLALDTAGGMYVADRDNHRVLYYSPDGDSIADRVYGQYGDLTAHISNNNGAGNSAAPSANSLSMPTAVAVDSAGGLFVTDRDNHRVLYFAPDGDTTADRVYGQVGNFNTNMVNNDGFGAYGEPGRDNLGTYILGIAVDASDGLFVSDSSNHRVLYYASDGDTSADRVYGQWDQFTSDVRNNNGDGRIGTPSASSLNFPRGLAVDAQGSLYIADRDNNRILYFANDGDTVADRVYGQFGDFTTNVKTNDGTGAGGTPNADNLDHPKAIAIGPAGGLYVADSFHHRVLYFAPEGDTSANGVYGQPRSMTIGIANNDGQGNTGAPSQDNLNGPQGIVVAPDGRFYVADTNNHRILFVECPQWLG